MIKRNTKSKANKEPKHLTSSVSSSPGTPSALHIMRSRINTKRHKRRDINSETLTIALLSDPLHSSVSGICRRAHFSRLVFYRRYKSKEIALEKIQEKIQEDFLAFISSQILLLEASRNPAAKSSPGSLIHNVKDKTKPEAIMRAESNKRLIKSLFIYMAKKHHLFTAIMMSPITDMLLKDLILEFIDNLNITWGPITPPTKDDLPIKLLVSQVIEILKVWAERHECSISSLEPYQNAVVEIVEDARIKCKISVW